jgi:hypothetical protein
MVAEVPRSLDNICIEYAILFEVVGNRVLSQQRCLQTDFSPDPFSFVVGGVERMIATSAAAELWTEICALDLIELLDPAPGFVARRARNVDLQSHNSHDSESGFLNAPSCPLRF